MKLEFFVLFSFWCLFYTTYSSDHIYPGIHTDMYIFTLIRKKNQKKKTLLSYCLPSSLFLSPFFARSMHVPGISHKINQHAIYSVNTLSCYCCCVEILLKMKQKKNKKMSTPQTKFLYVILFMPLYLFAFSAYIKKTFKTEYKGTKHSSERQ